MGVGVIGCELFKNFVLVGLGIRGSGSVIVVDMDYIERFNFSR